MTFAPLGALKDLDESSRRREMTGLHCQLRPCRAHDSLSTRITGGSTSFGQLLLACKSKLFQNPKPEHAHVSSDLDFPKRRRGNRSIMAMGMVKFVVDTRHTSDCSALRKSHTVLTQSSERRQQTDQMRIRWSVSLSSMIWKVLQYH